jgi:SHS2 domain-containing protein
MLVRGHYSRSAGALGKAKDGEKMITYRYLEDVAIADVAFEAQGKTLTELFLNAALAVTNTMVKDVGTVDQRVAKSFELDADDPEMLLYCFLQELVFYKDAELLLFSKFDLDIRRGIGRWRLIATARGEEISPEKHELGTDIKAVSLHHFNVQKTAQGWKANVILDV